MNYLQNVLIYKKTRAEKKRFFFSDHRPPPLGHNERSGYSRAAGEARRPRGAARSSPAGGPARRLRPGRSTSSCGPGLEPEAKLTTILQFFGRLVLGCSKTNFGNKICVWQHFSSSTRFASFCTAAISIFFAKNRFEKTAIKFFSKKLQMSKNLQKFVKFQKFQLENLVDFEKCCKPHI